MTFIIECVLGFINFLFGRSTVDSIDLENPKTFQAVGSVTMALSTDIYPTTKTNVDFDNDFSIFEKQQNYFNNGKIIEKIGADANEYMPKMLFWDWKGDETVQIKGARILAIRGTQSANEWIGNLDCEEVPGSKLDIDIDGVFHKNFGTIANKIWKRYKELILKSKHPVIITGHSRGAGIAEILYVIAKKEIIKKKLKLPIYCMAYAPPPTMSLNDTNSKELTKDIHAFVNGKDAVPRFFVGEFIRYYNKYKNTKKIVNAIFHAKGIISGIVPIGLSNDDAAKFGNKIASYFPQFNKSIIVNSIVAKKDDLYKIMENFQFNPDNVKIKEHVGTVYQIDRKKSSSKKSDDCTVKPNVTKLENPKDLSKLNILKITEITSFANDHNPKLYQQAFISTKCAI